MAIHRGPLSKWSIKKFHEGCPISSEAKTNQLGFELYHNYDKL